MKYVVHIETDLNDLCGNSLRIFEASSEEDAEEILRGVLAEYKGVVAATLYEANEISKKWF